MRLLSTAHQPTRLIRRHLRQRLQPAQLLAAPNKGRLREDWLRACFPRKHAFFQENPRRFRRTYLSTRSILAVFPSSAGPAYARTVPRGASLERRARRLLSLRLSSADRELERTFQTERRSPLPFAEPMEGGLLTETLEAVHLRSLHRASLRALFAEEGEAALRGSPVARPLPAFDPSLHALTLTLADSLRTPLFLGESTPYFFGRPYSTAAKRAIAALGQQLRLQLRLHGKRGRRRRRRRRFPPRQALAFRYRLKGRTVARGRTEFAT